MKLSEEQLESILIECGWFYSTFLGELIFNYEEYTDMRQYIPHLVKHINTEIESLKYNDTVEGD